jgi:hypothetical protein
VIYRLIRLCGALVVFTALGSASTILFGLGADPNQNYSFSPVGSLPGVIDTEPVGPYAGWLGQNVSADDNFFFCITFLKTATWGDSYAGTLITPSTPQQLEAAYLGAELQSLGGPNASLAQMGAISMAIWQVTDLTAGDVPRDPAAQPYVAGAVNAYNRGTLSASDFPNTVIFVPNDNSIQEFMMEGASNPSFAQLQAESGSVPEPGTTTLFLAGAGMLGISRMLKRRQK